MQRLVLDQDIRQMSDFRSNVSGFIKQVHTTKRPIVITQHGKQQNKLKMEKACLTIKPLIS